MNNVLEISALCKTYRADTATPVAVLQGVDLCIAEGEIVALIAPSGSGKSTLLHICGLLDRADSGTISIAGTPVPSSDERARTRLRSRELGFVYQFHHLLGEFSALENVYLPLLAGGHDKKSARERARSLLVSAGLESRVDHRPASLSGGEQQRVALCRALANAPKVLLADEPTGNLDPDTSAEMFDLIVSMVRKAGLSALIATHNMDLAARMDRIVSLDAGKLRPASLTRGEKRL